MIYFLQEQIIVEEQLDVSEEKMEIYGFVMVVHDPPIPQFFQQLEKLASKIRDSDTIFGIYIVDSSNDKTQVTINNFILSIGLSYAPHVNIHYFRETENFGAGHSYNIGCSLAFQNGCKAVTLLDDDVIILDNFNPKDIFAFYKNLNTSDTLALPTDKCTAKLFNSRQDRRFFIGTTFSRDLFTKINFREDFVIDWTDCDFAKRVLKQGGINAVYPEIVINMLPSGRVVRDGHSYFPYWREYLISRNTLTILREDRDLMALISFVWAVISVGYKGIRAHQKLLLVVKALSLGVFDAIQGNLGITENLQKLSNFRFTKI